MKLKFKGALDRFCGSYGFSPAEDSTRVLTIKVKDRKHSRIVYSVDFAIVDDYLDEDNQPCQEYIRFDKKHNRYTWEEQPNGYYELPEKIEWVKEHDLWHRVRELYIEKKNSNTDPNVHSRSIFANTVHQVCQQNGYFDD